MSKKVNGFISIAVALALLLGVVGIIILFVLRNDKADISPLTHYPLPISQNSLPTSHNLLPTAYNPSPTSFPFQEMTIPSLQSRSYDSRLGELTKVSENSDFTTYTTYYDSDGFRVNGLLTIPSGPAPRSLEGGVGWPAVVFVHGYIPPSVYETESNYVSYVNALADDGLVVFKIDLRGHDDSEGEAHGAYYSEQYIVDVLNAHAALQNLDYVDDERIGLWGHSMGGNVVFRSLVASEEIKKAVIWAGAVYTYEDFGEYEISDGSYRPPSDQSESRRRRERLFAAHGQFEPDSEFWKQIPATNYLDGVTDSVQLHHAVDDNVVGIDYSRNLIKILESTQMGHELFEYTSGGHNLTGSAFNQAMNRSADFLNH